jgi:membrane protease YdiL (CAAX protease family)
LYGGGVIAVVAGAMYATGAASFSGLRPGAAAAPGDILRLLAFLLLAAAFEELAFRGYAFQRLVEALGPLAATIVSSAFFSLAHLRNPEATLLSSVNTALAGGLLAVAYLRTRGLWMPIGLHFAWNLFQGPVFSFPVSGYRMPELALEAHLAGPVWLTGGGFGPEGSILLTGVAVVAIAVLTWLPGLASSPGADLGVDLGQS